MAMKQNYAQLLPNVPSRFSRSRPRNSFSHVPDDDDDEEEDDGFAFEHTNKMFPGVAAATAAAANTTALPPQECGVMNYYITS
jgi:hypothetical protein